MINFIEEKLKKLPYIIPLTINRLKAGLPVQIENFVYAKKGRKQHMDPRFKRSITDVLRVLLVCYDLPTRQIIRYIGPNLFAPVTEEWVAKEADISRKTVQRVFNFLHEMGILLWEKQKKCKLNVKNANKYAFYSVTRILSDIFFEFMQLSRALVECREGRVAKRYISPSAKIKDVVKKALKAMKPAETPTRIHVKPEILYGKSMFDDEEYVKSLHLPPNLLAIVEEVRNRKHRFKRMYEAGLIK